MHTARLFLYSVYKVWVGDYIACIVTGCAKTNTRLQQPHSQVTPEYKAGVTVALFADLGTRLGSQEQK